MKLSHDRRGAGGCRLWIRGPPSPRRSSCFEAAADGSEIVVFSRGVHPGNPVWIDTRPIWDGDDAVVHDARRPGRSRAGPRHRPASAPPPGMLASTS